DVNGDGLPDIYFTANNRGGNKLYLNKGNFTFEDITENAGVAGLADWCSGVTIADVNGDGLLDIYVSAVSNVYGLAGHNMLYINGGKTADGKVTFAEKSAEYGLAFNGLGTQAAFFDYDKDGDLDCYVLAHSRSPHANIKDTANRRVYDSLSGDRLYRNDLAATGRFTDVSATAGIYQSNLGYGLGLAVADFNNDGWEDVYVGNDFHENDYYYVNNGDGTFSEKGAETFGHYSRFSMGNDVADYNNDGQLDLITVDMLPADEKVLKTYGSDENPDIYKMKLERNGYQHQYSRNVLQQNKGNGSSFSEVGLLNGVSATDWSWSPLFADFDNDGKKDLFISSGTVKRPMDLDYIRFVSDLQMRGGLNRTDKYDALAEEKMPEGSSYPFLFKGSGGDGFEDKSEDWGTKDLKGFHTGAAYADLDNDGDLDLVMNSINATASVLKNNTTKSAYLSFSFQGSGANTGGIGAKVYLFQNGKTQYQQLMLTRGFQSASDGRLHFGLGNAAVDSVLVVWPDLKYQVLKNITPDQSITLQQKGAGGRFVHEAFFKAPQPLLSSLQQIKTGWQHTENDFVDFNVQYLIPHAQSTRGPKIAVGDVNGDGLDDFYACGAKGQAGALFIQKEKETFLPVNESLFAADAGCEDVDALFFDADDNGTLDLYVVSGGNEYVGENEWLLDRLYLNDGKGAFTKAADALPLIYQNKSCVTVSDVDKDGDLDVFVGNLAHAKAYGVPQTSYLLINGGKGRFTVATENTFTDMGMVTAAAFADVNSDGWPDLVAAGEWMPLTIFINKRGQFEKTAIPSSSGWWQTLLLDDVNGDGHIDILAGNWGWNNKFWSGKNGPVKLYVSDFDKNGQTDQLLSYTKDGIEYPFLAKDEMERALPVLRKHYLLYAEYAGLPMKDAFYGFAETVTPLQAGRLGSAVAFGNGKGGFELKDLPSHLQMAPIFSFQKIKGAAGNYYMAGGNFFDVIPYEGRYDAQPLALFSFQKSGEVQYLHQSQLSAVKGQVRDVKALRTAGQKNILVVARNNEALLFYSPNF
ncbi:MAG: VCBS repeat-containing protein, partial [Chitinophagaceae bacterium]